MVDMLKEIEKITDEAEARTILMRLGNGLTQVEMLIKEWKNSKNKVITETAVETVNLVKPTAVAPKTIVKK